MATPAAFLERLRSWIETVDPGTGFEAQLRWNLENTFGANDRQGVFVRSDTNVEDLPGFSGAGLNLTLPNVVGFENVVAAIQKVWASPFSARAFACSSSTTGARAESITSFTSSRAV